ncbi:MAG: hypothetical protein AB7U98_07720 [Candidatus Nitrosocosmicus sp.]|uniref:hypothetical protein n=1 Tax=Candidatus Nitrosocosmicus sp. FF01 TaxID=3397670 RepID=UPI0039ECED68
MHSLSVETEIVMKCSNESEAIVIYNSLISDNIGIPAFMNLDMRIDQRDFLLYIRFTQGENRENNINTLVNTIDEIMEHISLVRNVISID